MRQQQRSRRGQRGTTIVETMCAAAVLATGIAGLCSLAGASASLRQAGVQKEAARRAIDRQLATVAATDFADILATYENAGFTVTQEGGTGETLVAPYGDADHKPGHVQVTAPTGNPAELLEIEVAVEWNSAHGPQSLARRIRLSRLGSGS